MAINKVKGSKNGQQKYRVRVYVEGKQIEKIVYGVANAKATEMQLLSSTSTSNITVEQLCTEYLVYKKLEIRETSLGICTRNINKYISPFFSNYKIEKLSVKKMNDWKLWLNEFSLGLATKKNIYILFNAIIDYAVKLEYISSNNLRKTGNFKDVNLELEQKEVAFYTANQFKLFIQTSLDNCKTIQDWNSYVFFNIAFLTGMRKGEIFALKWNDLNNNVLTVNKSFNKRNNIISPPKNKSSIRNISISVQLQNVLQVHKDRLIKSMLYKDDDYILINISEAKLQKHNKDTANNCNLNKIRIHDFRHSHASLLINANINIFEISKRLGHSKVETTWNTYGHLYPDSENQIIEVLDKI